MEGEGEMEVSDSEDEPQRKKLRSQTDINEECEKLQLLKDEADSLRCQLEAYKNEVPARPKNMWKVCSDENFWC